MEEPIDFAVPVGWTVEEIHGVGHGLIVTARPDTHAGDA